MKINYTAPQKERERVVIGEDSLIKQFRGLTPQQAADWVQNNVNDLASAKTVLKAMTKVIVYLLRNEIKR